jgi:hypothetical protein
VGQTPSRERELAAELRIVRPALDETLLEGQCPADALERFSGLPGTLSVDEAAEAIGVSRATAFRECANVRPWLATALDSAR